MCLTYLTVYVYKWWRARTRRRPASSPAQSQPAWTQPRIQGSRDHLTKSPISFSHLHHRVGRVLSFLSSRWNWDSPTSSPAGECAPPFGFWGRGAHLLAREGVGESQFRRGDIHRGTLWYFVVSTKGFLNIDDFIGTVNMHRLVVSDNRSHL